MIRSFNETAQLLDQLKRVYKARGVRYADVARRIGVSEMTVKRAMAGRGLSVAMLEKMAMVVDVGIFDLAQMAREHSESFPAMSAEQAQRLTATGGGWGWTSSIRRAGALSCACRTCIVIRPPN